MAAETIAEHPSAFDNRAIPAVVFTDPELAWVGVTEQQAKDEGLSVTIGRFPLSALGRARTMGRTDGLVKVLSDPETDAVIGVGMVGPHASELIAEGALALEMGATLEDLGSKNGTFVGDRRVDHPTRLADRDRLCVALGYPDWTSLERDLEEHRRNVTREFDAIAFRGRKGDAADEVELHRAVGQLDPRAPPAPPREQGIEEGPTPQALEVAKALRRIRIRRCDEGVELGAVGVALGLDVDEQYTSFVEWPGDRLIIVRETRG